MCIRDRIFYVYEKEILSALTNVISQSTAIAIQQAIIKQDAVSYTHLDVYKRQAKR